MVDFDKTKEFLDNLFAKEETLKILEKNNLTLQQIRIINTLIIYALKAYDSDTQENIDPQPLLNN